MQLLTVIATSRDREAAKEISDALAGSARVRLLAESADSDQLLADVLRLRPSAVIMVLEADHSEKEFALIKQIASACPETAVITAARNASPALILGSIRSGAREFLQLPIIADEFTTVLDHVAQLCTAGTSASKKSGRIVAVFSSKGGAGVSFFAANLAASMNAPTLLADLNLHSGDAATFLGLEAKYSLADFVVNRTRLDDSLINSLITSYSARLSLLAAPLEAHEVEDVTPQDVTEVLHLLGQRYDCIVLDLPNAFDSVTLAALDMADDILLLMTLDIPGIRGTKRALKVFERVGYPRTKIHVVVNRWTKDIDVELKKVEAHLDGQLIGFVPNDYRKVMESINLGRPLVEADPSSKITTEIKRIAALVSNERQAISSHPRKGFLGSVFGRHGSTGSLEFSKLPDTA
jgi:pilus assembly protein CpaE